MIPKIVIDMENLKSQCVSVKCVVVKLGFKMESIGCFCLERFISLSLFIWVFCSSCWKAKVAKTNVSFFQMFIIVIIIIRADNMNYDHFKCLFFSCVRMKWTFC